ncbi:MAG: catalase family protein [Nitrospirales bacterium]|nr:catalase family protein [Nitrospira sp.]MDR4501001.1 catalase family protein [Nitrospirales bacterium]
MKTLIHKARQYVFWTMAIGLALLVIGGCAHRTGLKLGQEQEPPDEKQTIENIKSLLSTQLAKQYEGKEFLRDTHPKSNGCVKARFIVDPEIPEKFQVGVFEKGHSYPAWLRFSNSAPEVTPDQDQDFRGLAIKLFDVKGERLPIPGDEQHTQDFLFIAFPGFFAGTPKDFFEFFDGEFNGGPLATKAYFAKRPRALRNTLKGRKQFANPLEITWFSVAPFQLGAPNPDGSALAVKYKVKSCIERQSPLPDQPSDDYLEEAMARDLARGDWCLEFLIQVQQDPDTMPVEDTLAVWDEEKAPFTKVATIQIPRQTFTSDAQKLFCEDLSFNPWHGLTVHKPLGGINRARRDEMKAISDLRLKQRGVTRTEPTGLETF